MHNFHWFLTVGSTEEGKKSPSNETGGYRLPVIRRMPDNFTPPPHKVIKMEPGKIYSLKNSNGTIKVISSSRTAAEPVVRSGVLMTSQTPMTSQTRQNDDDAPHRHVQQQRASNVTSRAMSLNNVISCGASSVTAPGENKVTTDGVPRRRKSQNNSSTTSTIDKLTEDNIYNDKTEDEVIKMDNEIKMEGNAAVVIKKDAVGKDEMMKETVPSVNDITVNDIVPSAEELNSQPLDTVNKENIELTAESLPDENETAPPVIVKITVKSNTAATGNSVEENKEHTDSTAENTIKEKGVSNQDSSVSLDNDKAKEKNTQTAQIDSTEENLENESNDQDLKASSVETTTNNAESGQPTHDSTGEGSTKDKEDSNDTMGDIINSTEAASEDKGTGENTVDKKDKDNENISKIKVGDSNEGTVRTESNEEVKNSASGRSTENIESSDSEDEIVEPSDAVAILNLGPIIDNVYPVAVQGINNEDDAINNDSDYEIIANEDIVELINPKLKFTRNLSLEDLMNSYNRNTIRRKPATRSQTARSQKKDDSAENGDKSSSENKNMSRPKTRQHIKNFISLDDVIKNTETAKGKTCEPVDEEKHNSDEDEKPSEEIVSLILMHFKRLCFRYN